MHGTWAGYIGGSRRKQNRKGEHSSYCRKVEQLGHKFKIKATIKVTGNEQMPYFECREEEKSHTTTVKRFWSLSDSQTLRGTLGSREAITLTILEPTR